MFVRRIKEFINQLAAFSDVEEWEQSFLNTLKKNYLLLNPDSEINDFQLTQLACVYKQRWDYIVDTRHDYTFDPSGINTCWINLAHDIAIEKNISYLEILIPTVKNKLDPNLLTKLNTCTELRGFYLSQDKHVLHRVRGLFERIENKHPLSTFNNLHQYKPRALSLNELNRIRSKIGIDLKFDFDGKDYNNFWDYLLQEVIPKLSSSGECPRWLLSSLMELVGLYFFYERSESGFALFNAKLQQWILSILDCPVDTVNRLYGQVITVPNGRLYLVEVLLDCMHPANDDLRNKMLGVADWLSRVDPSLILDNDAVLPLYKQLSIGPCFTLTSFKQHILALKDDGSLRVRRAIESYVDKIHEKQMIDVSLITGLRELYRQRWLQILGRYNDYTVLQDGNNAQWIRLAQLLSGANLINKHYYYFLMPTLEHHLDSVQQEPLISYPLSHYVLSEDAKQLILLDNSAARYRHTNTFFNCNSIPPTPFTKIELGRLATANKLFYKYIELTQNINDEKDPPILLSTVNAVKQLVDGSLFPKGLLYAHDYSQTQMATAEKAYQLFFKFMHDLPEDERQRLKAQHIFFHGKNSTFADVLHQVEQNECIAVYGQYFAQLVMDYAPYFRFRREIEDKVAINEMRANSRKKIFRDYETIDQVDALSRIQILMFNLLTHHFYHLPMAGIEIAAFGYKNIINKEAKVVYDQIMPLLISNDIKNIRFVYAEVMETSVNSVLAYQGYSIGIGRKSETQRWLMSINTGILFKEKNNQLFDLKHIFMVIIPFIQNKKSLSLDVEQFADKLVHVLVCSSTNISHKVTLNIDFKQLLSTLDLATKEQILLALARIAEKLDNVSYHQLLVDFVGHRLACIFAGNDSKQATFFITNRSYNEEAYMTVKKLLSLHPKSIDSLDSIMSSLQARLVHLLNTPQHKAVLNKVMHYWERLTSHVIVLDKFQPDTITNGFPLT